MTSHLNLNLNLPFQSQPTRPPGVPSSPPPCVRMVEKPLKIVAHAPRASRRGCGALRSAQRNVVPWADNVATRPGGARVGGGLRDDDRRGVVAGAQRARAAPARHAAAEPAGWLARASVGAAQVLTQQRAGRPLDLQRGAPRLSQVEDLGARGRFAIRVRLLRLRVGRMRRERECGGTHEARLDGPLVRVFEEAVPALRLREELHLENGRSGEVSRR